MTEQQTRRIEKIESQIKKIDSNIRYYKILAKSLIILGFVSIFVIYHLLLNGSTGEKDLIDKLGSTSGGIVTSTFSVAGLVLVYVAFLGQKQQLLHQQIELELTRSEMKNQQLEMKRQNETLELQKFENLFFQLLSNYQNTKNTFYVLNEKNLFQKFLEVFLINAPNKNELSLSNFNITHGYTKTLRDTNFDTSFLLQVNSILKFLYKDDNEYVNIDLYIDIFSSTISMPEKNCIFLIYNLGNNLSKEDKENIDKSEILKNITLASI